MREEGIGKREERGFTLIELLVVIAMIAIIAGALTTGVAKAQRRTKISRAQTEAREITNAILAYQNYDEDGSLSKYTMNDQEADEGSLAFILGKVKSRNSDVPVLYNAALTRGKILDPWGNVYKFQIKQLSGEREEGNSATYLRAANLPNFYRLTDEERQ